MIKTISVSELKANLSRYLRRVRNGGEVQIVSRGEPVGRLVGVGAAVDADRRRDRLVAQGVLRPGRGRSLDALPARTRRLSGGDLSGALNEERGDRV